MSHVDPKFNTMIIEAISICFWDLVITSGGKNTFPGMEIELLDNNMLTIGVKSYTQEAIDFFDEDVSTKVSSPENKNQHKVNPYSPTLTKK